MSSRQRTPRPTGRRLLLVTALACVLVFPGAGEAKAARGLELALQDDPVFVIPTYFDRERAFEHLRALGVTRLRVALGWASSMPPEQAGSETEPSEIAWQFGNHDALIDAAARHGVRVHLSLSGPAPAWATSNRVIGPRRPDASLFGEFATVAANHFAGRVDRYSIWNEPNWKGWLNPTSGALYRALYLKGYGAIKRTDPEADVLIGETSPYARRGFSIAPLAFLREVGCVNKRYKRVKRCPKLRADGYAHHPYEFRRPPTYRYPGRDNATMGTLSNLTRALDRLSRAGALRTNGGGRMPVYLTEFGYFASGSRALSARKRAKYLPQAFGMALKNPRVRSQLQYLLVTPPKRFSFAFFNTALISTRGTLYPQYKSLRKWYLRNRSKVKRPRGAIDLPPPGGLADR